MTMTELEIAYRELEDALLVATPEQDAIARREFARRIAGEIKRQPDRADLWHKYGLCLYEIQNWTEDDSREIERAFTRAIHLDNGAIFSRIFLTHFYYDAKRYRESLEANCAADCKANYKMPLWRCCKMQELELCCLVELKSISESEFQVRLRDLQQLVSSVEGDFIEVAWPNELRQVMKENECFTEGIDTELLNWISSPL